MLLAQTTTGYIIEVLKVILPAILTLVAVYYGAQLAGRREDNLFEKRVKREEAIEEKGRMAELKAAARSVDLELRDATAHLQEELYFEKWVDAGREYPAAAFEAHRGLLAGELSDENWTFVSDAYAELNELNWLRRRHLQHYDPEDIETVETAPTPKRLRVTAVCLIRARRALAQYSKPRDIDQLMREDEEAVLLEAFPTFNEEIDKAQAAWQLQKNFEDAQKQYGRGGGQLPGEESPIV